MTYSKFRFCLRERAPSVSGEPNIRRWVRGRDGMKTPRLSSLSVLNLWVVVAASWGSFGASASQPARFYAALQHGFSRYFF